MSHLSLRSTLVKIKPFTWSSFNTCDHLLIPAVVVVVGVVVVVVVLIVSFNGISFVKSDVWLKITTSDSLVVLNVIG